MPETEVPGLPKFLRRYRFGNWKWIAPSVHLRPIILPYASDTRVFLLKSGPGTKMLEHTHTGIEMTCVLSGAFSQDGGHYGPGDFDLGDETIDHQPCCRCRTGLRLSRGNAGRTSTEWSDWSDYSAVCSLVS